MPKDSAAPYSAEMGFSHAELRAAIPKAVAPYTIVWHAAREWHFHYDAHRIVMTLAPESRRQLASLGLPTTRIDLDFGQTPAEEAARFLQKFRQSLQKGGG